MSLSGAHPTYRANLSLFGSPRPSPLSEVQAGMPGIAVPDGPVQRGNRLATWVRDRVGGDSRFVPRGRAWIPQSHNRHAHVSVAARQEARPPKGSAGGVMDFRDVDIIDFASGYRYKRAC